MAIQTRIKYSRKITGSLTREDFYKNLLKIDWSKLISER